MYHVDHDGAGGSWRVWWLDAQNCTRQILFPTEAAATQWVEFMESFRRPNDVPEG